MKIEFTLLKKNGVISTEEMTHFEVKLFTLLLENEYLNSFSLDQINLISKKDDILRLKIGDVEFSSKKFNIKD
jgi:hypothetical protein